MVFHAFGKKYPGVEINIFRSGTEEVVNKLLAENQVAEVFRKKNLCPIRPEQFIIAKKGNGIPARIKNVLYQGREIHYTVDVKGEEWQIITNDTVRFGTEEVVLKLFANP